MRSSLFSPPEILVAHALTALPAHWNTPRTSAWAQANRGIADIGSFIEGPAFDKAGNLYITDIPHGRIFRISPTLEWSLALAYDGWPNGLAVHRDGSLWIADYRRGLLRWDPAQDSAAPHTVLGHNNSEAFRGLNDLCFDATGHCYFTDQGQTGMHDPAGRVYRLGHDGRLDLLLSNVPSPNGIAFNLGESALYVAATRGNTVWRAPLFGGRPAKVGVYQHFFGAGGPDGLAVDSVGRLVVAHASLEGALVLEPSGAITHFIACPSGSVITNLAFRPGTAELVLTDSQSGTVFQATLPASGAALYSHALS